MSIPQSFPDPHHLYRGPLQAAPPRNLFRIAQLWRPKGLIGVNPYSLLASYSLRLIDRETGKAYSSDELEDKILALVASSQAQAQINFSFSITALTGGASNALDSIATEDLNVGTVQLVATAGDFGYLYILRSGTTAELSPRIVRPDDYAASTNEKYWEQISLIPNELSIWDPNNAYRVEVGTDALSANRQQYLVDAAGKIPAVPAYADNTAATSGGLSAGDCYWNTTSDKLTTVT